MGSGQQGSYVSAINGWGNGCGLIRGSCLHSKHTMADDKADLQDFKERFLKGEHLLIDVLM